MAMRREPQQHFDERNIHNEDLLIAIETMLRTRDAVRANRRAKKQIKKHTVDLPEGRYRCGPYVLTVRPMDGGGFDVAPWQTMVVSVSDD